MGTRVVLYVSAGQEGPPVAFVAGRRVGGAVARNRARRVLREAWRTVAPEVPEDRHVVAVARPAIVGAKTQDLVNEMRDLLRRGRIVRP